jgi:hypothetical protein
LEFPRIIFDSFRLDLLLLVYEGIDCACSHNRLITVQAEAPSGRLSEALLVLGFWPFLENCTPRAVISVDGTTPYIQTMTLAP